MCVVGLTSFVLTPWRIFLDPDRTPQSQNFSFFLFYISFFTLTSILFGLSVLKLKTRKNAEKTFARLALPIGLIICGLSVQALGYYSKNLLLILFPFLGHTTAYGHAKYWLKAPEEKKHWWYAHMDGMGVACIATVTAFLVTALPRMSDSVILNSAFIWIAPGIIGGILLKRSKAAYRRQTK